MTGHSIVIIGQFYSNVKFKQDRFNKRGDNLKFNLMLSRFPRHITLIKQEHEIFLSISAADTGA